MPARAADRPAKSAKSKHDADGFAASLSGLSAHTKRAYAHDAAEFVAWCERGELDPADLDHRTIRRYLGYLNTRGFARPTISRKAASVRGYVRYLRRRGVIDRDIAKDVQAPKGAKRLPRVPRRTETIDLLDRADAH